MKNKRERKSVEEKRRIVAGYERSGESQREYAGRMGIGLSTLSLRSRQAKSRSKRRLMEVEVAQHPGLVGVGSYRLTLPGGVCLEFGGGFEAPGLRSSLEVIRESH